MPSRPFSCPLIRVHSGSTTVSDLLQRPNSADSTMAAEQQRLAQGGRSGSLRTKSLPLERPEDAFTEVDEACDKLSQVLSDLCVAKADLLSGSGPEEARQLKLAAATALEDVARMLRTQGPAAAIAEVRSNQGRLGVAGAAGEALDWHERETAPPSMCLLVSYTPCNVSTASPAHAATAGGQCKPREGRSVSP